MIDTDQIAPSINPWEVMATLGAAVMETSWLVLLYQAMGHATASDPTWLPFSFFLAVIGIAGLVAKTMTRLQLNKTIGRAALAILLLLSYVAGSNILLQTAEEIVINPFDTSLNGVNEITRLIPGKVWLAVVLTWLVGRGFTFIWQGVDRFSALRFLRFGVGMFLVYGILSLSAARDLPGLSMFAIFLFATLTTMTATRVASLSKMRGGRRNPFNRDWLASVGGVILGTVGIGFSLALFAVGRLQVFIQFLLGLIIALVFSPLLLLVGLLVNVEIQPLPELSPAPEVISTPELPPWEQDGGLTSNLLDETNEKLAELPEATRPFVTWGGLLLGILLVALLIWGVGRAIRRLIQDPQVEYVVKRGDLMETIREQARGGLRPSDLLAGLNRLQRRQRTLAAERVRQIYSNLLDMCAEFDLLRFPAQTPLEFLGATQRALPSVSGQLSTITHAYLKVRYGELPETREEVLAVENAWEEVRRVGETRKQIVRAQKRADDLVQKLKEKSA